MVHITYARAPSAAQVEPYLRRLVGLCGDAACRSQMLGGGAAKILVHQVRTGPGRAVERAAELIGRLCTSGATARAALGAAGAVEALLEALDTHQRSPLVTEAAADALALLCDGGFWPNCRGLEKAGGIARLRGVAGEGGAWKGTPRAQRRCSEALRAASISGIRLDDLSDQPPRDRVAASGGRPALLRFRAAVKAVGCGVTLARRAVHEEQRWKLEESFFDGLRRAEELGRLFQEAATPG